MTDNLAVFDKNRIDCRDVVRRLLGEPQRSTPKHDVYYSPFRDDGSNAAFTVYEDGVKDYGGDGWGGDVIEFIQKYFNLPDDKAGFKEAIRYLTNEDYFLPVARKAQHNKAVGEPPSQAWQLAMRKFIEASHERLMNNPDVLHYLQVERGLSIVTIERYQLGWNSDWTDTDYRDDEGIVNAAPGILIPWDYDGQLWAVRVRQPVGSFAAFMGDTFNRYAYLSENKYKSIRGSRPNSGLFGAAIVAGDSYVILEGEFDAMLANERGPWKAVTRGSAGDHGNISPRWIKQLQTAEIVYSLLDNDEAGRLATQSLQQQLPNIQPLRLPAGKDFTEFIIQCGGQPSALEAQASLWWLGTMPDSWRSAILNYMPPSAAPVVEMIHEAARQGCINPCCFTLDELLEVVPSLGFDLPRSTVKRVVKETDQVFISKVGTLNSLTVLEESLYTNNTFEINAPAGRKPCQYRLNRLPDFRRKLLAWARPRIRERLFPTDGENALPTIFESPMLETIGFGPDEAATAKNAINQATTLYRDENNRLYCRRFNQLERIYRDLEMTLADLDSSELPPAKISSAIDYRALFLRADVEVGDNNNRTRKELAAVVGVSPNYVRKVEKHAGIQSVEKFETVPISSKIRHLEYDFEIKGRPQAINIEGQYLSPRESTAVEIVNEAISQGKKVEIKYQVASQQVIVRDDPLPVIPPVPAVPKTVMPKQRQLSFDDLQQPHVADEPLPDEVEQQQEEVNSPVNEPRETSDDQVTIIKPGKYFGPSYDPAWVYHQLVMALKASGSRYRLLPGKDPSTGKLIDGRSRLIDPSTGEIVRLNVETAFKQNPRLVGQELVMAITGDESLLEAVYLDAVAQ